MVHDATYALTAYRSGPLFLHIPRLRNVRLMPQQPLGYWAPAAGMHRFCMPGLPGVATVGPPILVGAIEGWAMLTPER